MRFVSYTESRRVGGYVCDPARMDFFCEFSDDEVRGVLDGGVDVYFDRDRDRLLRVVWGQTRIPEICR